MINNTKTNKNSMPFWQWVVILVFIALIVYGVFYYVFLPSQLSYNVVAPAAKNQPISPSPTSMLITRNDPVKGSILADSNGMSLYTFDKDTLNVSNCTGTCATIWPPFSTSLTAQDALPLNVTIIKRPDGTSQLAWKGLPMYFYSKDVNPGDVLGDGFGGIWHLIHP